MRAFFAVLLGAAACKEGGPTPAQLEAARQQLCAEHAPGIRVKLDQVRALAALGVPPAKAEQLPGRRLELRELHASKPAGANTDVGFAGEARGVIESCAATVAACEGDWLASTFEGCARIDSYVLVRPVESTKAVVDEAMLNKYKPGKVVGDALVFALPEDGGAPQQLGALLLDVKLRGGVEVERDATTAERQHALDEALRRAALAEIEAKLTAR